MIICRKLITTAVVVGKTARQLFNVLKERVLDYIDSFRKAETFSDIVALVTFNTLLPVIVCGLFGYVLVTVPQGEYEPFELATISALLGGFVFAGGFMSQSETRSALGLKRVGALYLASTIAFVVFGFYITLDKIATEGDALSKVTLVLVPISLYIAVLAFAWATAWLVTLIPQIWRRNRKANQE